MDLGGLLRNIVPWFPPGDAQPTPEPAPPADPSQMSAVDIYRQGVGLPTAAEEARNVAALRMANAVHPGLAPPPSPTGLEVAGETAGRLLRAPFESGGQGAEAMRRVYAGELNPLSPEGIGEAFQAGAQTLGQSPFAVRGAIGAGGGKLVQPTMPEATTGGVGYGNVPDTLMGFRKSGPNKPFPEQNYPYTLRVNVRFPDTGDVWEDAIKGLNKSHALERARRNWPGAEIKPVESE